MTNRKHSRCECGDHAFVPTNKWGVVLVSTEDENLLENYTFSLAKRKHHYYAQSNPLYRHTGSNLLHRAIVPGGLIDHENRNGLDNRRSNIRSATDAQNLMNASKRTGTSSSFKGVNWRRDKRKWRAYINLHGQQVNLGHFDYEATAALAYDKAAMELFGIFARLNFPPASVQGSGKVT